MKNKINAFISFLFFVMAFLLIYVMFNTGLNDGDLIFSIIMISAVTMMMIVVAFLNAIIFANANTEPEQVKKT